MADSANFEKKWKTVKSIPSGRVSTYGEIARMSGLPSRARFVSTALRAAPAELELPWHRVINAQGKISFARGSEKFKQQKSLLQEEGVVFRAGTIKLEEFAWKENCDELLWRI